MLHVIYTDNVLKKDRNMSPVIRVSDALYKKLEQLAVGFDTPVKVIERLVADALPPESISCEEENAVRKKITMSMIEQSYFQAKEMFAARASLTESKEILGLSGMSPASAQDYLLNFRQMMNGEKYTRTMSSAATIYFLENIKKDFGQKKFEKALSAVQSHVNYYNSLGHGRLNAIEEILKTFKRTGSSA